MLDSEEAYVRIEPTLEVEEEDGSESGDSEPDSGLSSRAGSTSDLTLRLGGASRADADDVDQEEAIVERRQAMPAVAAPALEETVSHFIGALMFFHSLEHGYC